VKTNTETEKKDTAPNTVPQAVTTPEKPSNAASYKKRLQELHRDCHRPEIVKMKDIKEKEEVNTLYTPVQTPKRKFPASAEKRSLQTREADWQEKPQESVWCFSYHTEYHAQKVFTRTFETGFEQFVHRLSRICGKVRTSILCII
jgi:hypothetical protein